MRRLVFVLAVVLALPAGAHAEGDHAGEVASALKSQPVYVAPARTNKLDAAAVGRLQVHIAEADIGRIHIAVIPAGWAREAGGVGTFANAVDQQLRIHGALLISADDDAYIVTSHEHSDEAVKGVQAAFEDDENAPLEDQLSASINALAEIDPGPSGDLDNGGSESPTTTIDFPDPQKIVDDVTNTIKFVVIAIVLAILAPFVFLFLRATFRARQHYVEDKETFEDALQAARDERAALGDDIVDLDTATSMPNVPASARTAYEKALDAYDKSEVKLAAADNPRRLIAVRKMIADGRAAAAQARAAVGPQLPG